MSPDETVAEPLGTGVPESVCAVDDGQYYLVADPRLAHYQRDELVEVIVRTGYICVLPGGGGSLTPAVRVYEPNSGRVMEVLTTEPGVVLYTSNTFDGTVRGKGGKPFVRWGALCLETQHFPDTPNKPHFPSVVLKPGGRYHSVTVFRFTTAP